MSTQFNTEIVKTNEFSKTLRIVFVILYLIAIFYVYFYDNESQNIYFKYLAVAIFISGIYFLFAQSFIKPKKIGTIKISAENIEFSANGITETIALNELENIFLKYMDYGGWTTHSIFGNKNYITITEKSGRKHDFEILIRNRNSKDNLKRILNSPEFHEKFDFIAMVNSRTEF